MTDGSAEKTPVEWQHSLGRMVTNQKALYNQLKESLQQKRVSDIENLLVHHNVDPNRPLNGMTALNMAVYADSIHMVNLLLQYGANVNDSSICRDSEEDEHEYPIISAARLAWKKDIVEALVVHGANVNCTDYARLTPLWYAASCNRYAAAEILLDNGATMELHMGEYGKTVLFAAVEMKHIDMVKLLVERGALVNKQDETQRNSPLHWISDDSLQIADYLLKNGAIVNLQNRNSHTPLYSALLRNRFKAARLLIQHGADVNIVSNLQNEPTSLALAIEEESFFTARMIVEAGCNLSREYQSAEQDVLQKMTSDNEFYEFIRPKIDCARSLKQICRIYLRQFFIVNNHGCTVLPSLECLPLPKEIIKYLCFSWDMYCQDS